MALKLKHTTPPQEVSLGSVRSRARTGIQPEVDADAAKLKTAWEAAGKPSYDTLTALDSEGNASPEFAKAEKIWYVVDGDDRAELKKIIRRACLFHKGLPVYAADTKNDDGTVTVGFTYGPKPVTPSDTSPTPSGDTEGTPETPGTNDQEAPDESTGRRSRFGRG